MQKQLKYSILSVLIGLALCSSASTQEKPDARSKLKEKLIAQIEEFDRNWDGVFGMAALDLTTGEIIHYNGNVVFPQASSIKIPILMEVYRQALVEKRFSLGDTLTLTPSDWVGGSGRLKEELKSGRSIRRTVRQLLEAMIIWSDNVATNVLIRRVGKEAVNKMLSSLDRVDTRLQREMMDSNAVANNEENISTPRDMVRLMKTLYEGRFIRRDACDSMLAILKRVQAGMRSAVPEEYDVAAKPGGVPGVSCETGIIFLPGRPFALSVMSTFNNSGVGRPAREVTRMVFDYFERLANSNIYGHRIRKRPNHTESTRK